METAQTPNWEPLRALLHRRIAFRGLSHAYILDGPSGPDRIALSQQMAAAWVCEGSGDCPCLVCRHCRKALRNIHPDIFRVGDNDTGLTVAQIRALRADAYIRPNEAERKVYLLENAHTMNQNAQNAMLKLLEEGPPYAAFLFLTDNAAALLPTVRSRCEVLSFSPPAQHAPGEETVLQARVSALTFLRLFTQGDELSFLEYCVGLESWDKEHLPDLLDEIIQLLRHSLLCSTGADPGEDNPECLRVVRQAGEELSRRRLLTAVDTLNRLRTAASFHTGSGHLVGWLCAELFQDHVPF